MAWPDLSIFAIIIAIILNVVIGALWYSPLLFGKTWMKFKGLKDEDLKNASPAMAFSSLGGVVAMIILAIMIGFSRADTILEGIFIGILVGSLTTTTFLNSAIYDKDEGLGDRMKVWLIGLGYTLISYSAAGAIFAV